MSKVLIVDDEQSIRRILRDILEFEKYEVEEAVNGMDCLVKLKQKKQETETSAAQSPTAIEHLSEQTRLRGEAQVKRQQLSEELLVRRSTRLDGLFIGVFASACWSVCVLCLISIPLFLYSFDLYTSFCL